jgi:hypothetical protein
MIDETKKSKRCVITKTVTTLISLFIFSCVSLVVLSIDHMHDRDSFSKNFNEDSFHNKVTLKIIL